MKLLSISCLILAVFTFFVVSESSSVEAKRATKYIKRRSAYKKQAAKQATKTTETSSNEQQKTGLAKIVADSAKVCKDRYEDSEKRQKICKDKMHEGFLGVTNFMKANDIDKLDIRKEMENGNQMAQIFASCSAKWKEPNGLYWDKIYKCIKLEVQAFEKKEREYADDF